MSVAVHSFNSTTDQNVTYYEWGPAGINSNSQAQTLGFLVSSVTSVGGRYCPGNVYTGSYSCKRDAGYCHASPPWTEVWGSGSNTGNMSLVIPPDTSGARVKVQLMYRRSSSDIARIRVNDNIVWTGNACASCPQIVTLSVSPGDLLVLEQQSGGVMALFQLELWQYSAFPTHALTLTSSIGSTGVQTPGEQCDVCPVGFQGGNTSCLSTSTPGVTFAPTSPPPPVTPKEVGQKF